MLVTFSVLKPLRSRDFNDSQPANIRLISVTKLVFRYLIPVMESRLVILLNQLRVEMGRALTNVESNCTWVMLAVTSDQAG